MYVYCINVGVSMIERFFVINGIGVKMFEINYCIWYIVMFKMSKIILLLIC